MKIILSSAVAAALGAPISGGQGENDHRALSSCSGCAALSAGDCKDSNNDVCYNSGVGGCPAGTDPCGPNATSCCDGAPRKCEHLNFGDNTCLDRDMYDACPKGTTSCDGTTNKASCALCLCIHDNVEDGSCVVPANATAILEKYGGCPPGSSPCNPSCAERGLVPCDTGILPFKHCYDFDETTQCLVNGDLDKLKYGACETDSDCLGAFLGDAGSSSRFWIEACYFGFIFRKYTEDCVEDQCVVGSQASNGGFFPVFEYASGNCFDYACMGPPGGYIVDVNVPFISCLTAGSD